MKQIIYFNDSGFPYSVLVAATKSGELPIQRLPELKELEKVLSRCGLGKGDATIYHLGFDKLGNKCLALWSKGNGDMIRRATKSFLGLFNIKDYELVEIPNLKSFILTMGILMAKLPGFQRIGFSIIHRHIKHVYKQILYTAGYPPL